MYSNLLIEASAGTGKTQALAERLIELIGQDVKPQEIVALTFSRAAAGEIFERFVTLLADGVSKHPEYANRLREVIETQHLSQIGTLDSFLMRIVRTFPLELGIIGRLEMMDEYQTAAERSRVSFGILRRTDTALKRAFGEAFALAMNRENVRSFTETYRTFVKEWHERFLAIPSAEAWGDTSAAGLDIGEEWLCDSATLARRADALVGIVNAPAWMEFVEWVRNFRGSFTGIKGFAKKFLEMDNLLDGATIDVSFNRKNYSFGGADAKAIREAVKAAVGYVLRMKVEMARGVFTLVSSFESEYAKKVRNAGRLVFADVPRMIMNLSDDARMALEYRMDSKLRAWALDEFQDTSREQWKALSGLIEEAKQSAGEKSVFIVGDCKQAIYGWRNGDVGIFAGERDSGQYATEELNKSWRYGEPIVKAINAVFVHGRLLDEFAEWKSPEHMTARPDLPGFVQTVESPGSKKEDFIEPVYNALKAVDPVGRRISAAVLVRTNDLGEMMAVELKRRGLEGVVWEGESAILDTPALLPFLDILDLADHPGDKQAYEHFIRSPLSEAKYGAEIPSAAELSREFALSFSTKGVVRTFRELRACLPESPTEAWSEFTEVRFTDMLRAASEFELSMEPGVRLSDFSAYLSSRKKRNVAEPGKIRIMTIHRSKGLGFDYVVLPLYEHEGLDAEPDGPLMSDRWVLPDPGMKVNRLVPGLMDAWRKRKARSEQEALCAYYVAMTRAKQAMTIVLHPAAKASVSRRFSEFVREAIPEPIGNPEWYLSHGNAEYTEIFGESSAEVRSDIPYRAPRKMVARRLPSLSFHTGESAGNLFASNSIRKSAIERGVAAHEEYERIEWLDAAEATSDFDRELVKPEGVTALWREWAFEILSDGEWTSGRFDRVVFANGKATVYDFKTNAIHRGESTAEFESRMRLAYAAQMRSYREAIAALTGIAAENIFSKLLLVSTKTVISM